MKNFLIIIVMLSTWVISIIIGIKYYNKPSCTLPVESIYGLGWRQGQIRAFEIANKRIIYPGNPPYNWRDTLKLDTDNFLKDYVNEK